MHTVGMFDMFVLLSTISKIHIKETLPDKELSKAELKQFNK